MNWLIIILITLILLFVVFQYLVWKNRKKWSEKDKKFFRDSWQKIIDNRDHSHRLLEADKLFDHMLKRKGYSGSLGEKLKKHGDQFSDLDALWRAHKLRNKLAHEVDVSLSGPQVDIAINAYRRAFKDLGLDG